MAPQQSARALTTERAMQFITTIGEMFEGHGISQCKIKLHEAGHLIKRLTQWQKETFAILQLSQPGLLLLTFSQYYQEPFRWEELNSTFHLLNDFPTQYFIWGNNIAPLSPTHHNNPGQNIISQLQWNKMLNNKSHETLQRSSHPREQHQAKDYTLSFWTLLGRVKPGCLISVFVLKLETPLLYLSQIKIPITKNIYI